MTERKKSTKAVIDGNGKRVTPVTGRPASNRVEAPACRSCRSDRTIIYATRHMIRYVKCEHCGHSFSFAAPPAVVDDIQTR